MRVSLIVAMSENRVIGRDGDLPWRLSADLRRFKRLTMGHHIIMGRKTFESIGRLLPGRTSIVITRQTTYSATGALIARSLPEAFEMAAGDDEVFVIGGAEIYQLVLAQVDRLYVTRVHADVQGDVFFPELDFTDWTLIKETSNTADEKNAYDHSFLIYDRVHQPRPDNADPAVA